MNCALLLIDLQNDFLPGGALAVPKGEEVIPIANEMQSLFDHVIATVDWHPEHHGSFATTHNKEVGDVIELEGIEQILWPVHCVQGSEGAQFASGLLTENIEHFCKGGEDPSVDSYSGFFDNKHLRPTGLADYLRQEGITHLYAMGLATDYCVKYTVLDGLALGFQVTVIRDGCRAINLAPNDEQNAFDEMLQAGAEISTSDQVRARFKKSSTST